VRCACPDCPSADDGAHYHPQLHPELVPGEDGEAGARADLRPGFYYVSIQNDAGEQVLVRGPWYRHAEALAALPDVKAYCLKLDPRACWYAFGTARSEADLGPGLLGPAEMGE